MLPYAVDPNKIIIIQKSELVFSNYYKYDVDVVKQREKNTYYDKIINLHQNKIK